MEAIDMIVNSLPAPTWERLHMNRAQVSGIALESTGQYKALCEIATVCDVMRGKIALPPTGMGRDVEQLLAAADVQATEISLSPGQTDTIYLKIKYEPLAKAGNQFYVTVPDAAKMTLLMDYSDLEAAGEETPDDDKAGAVPQCAAVQVILDIGENATLTLVQVQRSHAKIFCNDIGGVCQKNAKFDLLQLFLAGDATYSGCEVLLEGEASSFTSHLAYSLSDARLLDMNYVARHVGKNTNSTMRANGSLRGSSRKCFRGTIDFVRGSAGAVGNESEEVLIIDDTAINQSVPLILCAEEDVEGNHGASIGRPDEDVLFYLGARGLDLEQAYRVLSMAKLEAVAGMIPVSDFRCKMLDKIHGGKADA